MRASFFLLRPSVVTSALVLTLAGCGSSGHMDWDLRSMSAGNTAAAVAQATQARPMADARGVISYPNYQVVVTRPGESVMAVAQRLKVDGNELARINAIEPNLILSGGELLVLPGRVAEPVGTGGFASGPVIAPAPISSSAITSTPLAPAPTAAARTTTTSTTTPARAEPLPFAVSNEPLPPQTTTAAARPAARATTGTEPARHKVARGESAYVIARRYNVSAQSLAEWNGLNAAMSLREGQTLLIPPADGSKPPARTVATTTTVPGQGSPTPTPPSAAKPLPQEKPTRVGNQAAATPAPAAPSLPTTAASSSRLAMPASGSIVRAYNKGKYDGIGIGAAAGSPVRAAAAGTVAAVTRDTEQVPIVVIRHEGNLLTVYANVDGVSVAKGASVTRGQQIGRVRAGNPAFLHFEVRRGTDSVDPMSLLQ